MRSHTDLDDAAVPSPEPRVDKVDVNTINADDGLTTYARDINARDDSQSTPEIPASEMASQPALEVATQPTPEVAPAQEPASTTKPARRRHIFKKDLPYAPPKPIIRVERRYLKKKMEEVVLYLMNHRIHDPPVSNS
ncbi:hypothetical protein QQX98_000922 [Neonectria punicea]|uniref:Uncharacterized protein n=1 Tax=Neonectria punicea TaxID=979145 RepID=A0ABR1HRB6_9HYPO